MSGKQTFFLLLIFVLLLALWLPNWVQPSPKLLFNPSKSADIGWYKVAPATDYSAGDLVAAYLPDEAEDLADRRGYLPKRVPVIKTIGAVAGDRYCITGGYLEIDPDLKLEILSFDSQGRAMPVLPEGCAVISADHVLLISERIDRSFDSRYFGEVHASNLLGHAEYLGFFAGVYLPESVGMGGARGLGAQGKIKARSAKEALAPCLHIIFYSANSMTLALIFSYLPINSMLFGGAKSWNIPLGHSYSDQ